MGQSFSLLLRASGGGAGYIWSVDNLYTLPPGISLTPGGMLAGIPQAPGAYIFNLRVRSNASDNSQPGQTLCHWNVNPSAVRLTSGCLMPAATVGVPYSQWLSADGGVAPYQYQLNGQLPLGLSLTPAGAISGTPLTPESFSFGISVADSRGKTSTQSCSLTVNSPAFALNSYCPLPAAITGAAYTANLPSAYTWALSGTLPAGLTLTPDGTISGTPMSAGPSRFLLLATDANGNQAAQICSLSVSRGALAINGCPLPDANTGEPYHAAVTALGGSAPYLLWPTGALPSGIQMTVDGQLSGTPTLAGSYAFGITMQGSGQTFTQACSLNVNPAVLHFSTSCPLPQAQLGQSYSAAVQAAGGTAPYQFDFFGFLPDGIQAGADGSVSGTPQAVGGQSFLVRVTDAQNNSTSSACSMNVVLPPAPQIQIGSVPATVAPAVTNLSVPIQLSQAYSEPVEGQVALNVQPNTHSSNALANQADPRLRFQNGQTVSSFTIPAGSTGINLPLLSTGTVASTVTVSLGNLRSAGANLNLYPTPAIFNIAPAAPVITSACYASAQSGLSLQIAGYSTTRELTSADIKVGSQDFQTDLTAISGAYFGSAQTVRAGGTFALTIPVGLDSIPSGAAVSLTVSNAVGATGSQTIPACQ